MHGLHGDWRAVHLGFSCVEPPKPPHFSDAFESFWGETEIEYSTRFAAALERKYKSRLLLFQAGPLFSVMAVLFVFIYFKVYLRSRRKLKHMEDVERGLSMDDY